MLLFHDTNYPGVSALAFCLLQGRTKCIAIITCFSFTFTSIDTLKVRVRHEGGGVGQEVKTRVPQSVLFAEGPSGCWVTGMP